MMTHSVQKLGISAVSVSTVVYFADVILPN